MMSAVVSRVPFKNYEVIVNQKIELQPILRNIARTFILFVNSFTLIAHKTTIDCKKKKNKEEIAHCAFPDIYIAHLDMD